MLRTIIYTGAAFVAVVPSVAHADMAACERQRSGRVVATVAGAGIGAVLGNVIAGRGNRALGTVIGGAGGGVLGNQIAKPGQDCSRAYGYYDSDNRWHASNVQSGEARGYFNRTGDWVEGPPNGYYDRQNRWIATNGNAADQGYYGPQGGWVPASASGYYDRNDQWIAASASGHYDSAGRWQQGNTNGHYDDRGRWTPGATNGQRDRDGNWVTTPQPGHYDRNGQWQAGASYGYYDNGGQWISASPDQQLNNAAMPSRNELRSRIASLDRSIRDSERNGWLNRRESYRAGREVNAIRSLERSMPNNRGGNLSARNQTSILARLDRLDASLAVSTEGRIARN